MLLFTACGNNDANDNMANDGVVEDKDGVIDENRNEDTTAGDVAGDAADGAGDIVDGAADAVDDAVGGVENAVDEMTGNDNKNDNKNNNNNSTNSNK